MGNRSSGIDFEKGLQSGLAFIAYHRSVEESKTVEGLPKADLSGAVLPSD